MEKRSAVAVALVCILSVGIGVWQWYVRLGNELCTRGFEIGSPWALLRPPLGFVRYVGALGRALERASGGDISARSVLATALLAGPLGPAILQTRINRFLENDGADIPVAIAASHSVGRH